MKLAGDFLSKFNKLAPPNDALRRAVVDIVHMICDIPLTKVQVGIRNAIAFVDVSNVIKNKIRMHRREILDAVHEKIPKSRELLRDIR